MAAQSYILNPKVYDEDMEKKTTRDGYAEALVEAGRKNSNIVVLTADLSRSVKVNKFEKEFPNRFYDVGVAEQNMAGIAAGLALSGKIPFMSSYAVFSPGRNWEQLRLTAGYSHANIKIVSTHAGFSTGADGATHQALEDIALMRVIPNITVVSPCDYYETKKAILEVAEFNGPVYVRLTRENTPIITTEKTPFEIGKAQILRPGKDITIIGTGPILYEALMAAKQLQDQDNISCEIINCSTIKPLDETTIIESAKKTQKVICVEEHQIAGGLGSAIAELLSEKSPTKIIRMGAKNTFGESGTYAELLAKYKLDKKAIINCVKEMCLG